MEGQIGIGACGEVWLGRQVSANRLVAVKLVRQQPAEMNSDEFNRVFLREGQALARIRHLNLVAVHVCGIADDTPYLIMEYLNKGSLEDRLDSWGDRLNLIDKLAVVVQIAHGLSVAHRRGLIHRNLKPANVMFRDRNTAVVTDFGWSHVVGVQSAKSVRSLIVGDFGYMSPEQCWGKDLDGRSDLYALGIVCFQMLAGKLPYSGSTVEIVTQHLEAHMPELPAEVCFLQPVIDRLLAKGRDERYADAEALIAGLRAVCRHSRDFQDQLVESDEEWADQLRQLGFEV